MDERLHVGPIHAVSEVRSAQALPQGIVLNEITLREEVVLPVKLTIPEKIDVASRLIDLGVKQIEIQTPDAADIVPAVHSANPGVRVQAICRPFFPDRYANWESEIEAAVHSGADSVIIVTRTSDPQLADLGLSRQDVLAAMPRYVNFTRDLGANHVVTAFADCTRASLDFIEALSLECAGAGADRIHVADTIGVMKPASMRYLVGKVLAWSGIPVGVHCHNDLGLALANALAALEAGATVVDCTLNGIDPERIGLTPVEQLAVVLYALYDYDSGIELERLRRTCEEFASITGVGMSIYQPIVGDNAFAQQRELTLQAAQRNPALFEAFDPAMVGNRRWVSLGSGAGLGAITAKLRELSIDADGLDLAALTVMVTERAATKRAPLSDEEFRALASSSVGS